MATNDLLARIESRARTYEAFCVEHGEFISHDGFISEATAARLLTLSAGALRNQRRDGCGPRHYKNTAGLRIAYLVRDLAEHTERRCYE